MRARKSTWVLIRHSVWGKNARKQAPEEESKSPNDIKWMIHTSYVHKSLVRIQPVVSRGSKDETHKLSIPEITLLKFYTKCMQVLDILVVYQLY